VGTRGDPVSDDVVFICLCEDVTVADLVRGFAAGFREPETLKRYTGACTGPCQGRLCLQAFVDSVAVLVGRAAPRRPSIRPPLSPVPLGVLAAGARDLEAPEC
jgi:sarcosine oxidase alpha subunit family protein